MTHVDHARGFVATPAVRPLYFLEWQIDHYFVYIAGIRTGALLVGAETCFYRSVTGEGRMFDSVIEAVAQLERLANWITVANAELVNTRPVYA